MRVAKLKIDGEPIYIEMSWHSYIREAERSICIGNEIIPIINEFISDIVKLSNGYEFGVRSRAGDYGAVCSISSTPDYELVVDIVTVLTANADSKYNRVYFTRGLDFFIEGIGFQRVRGTATTSRKVKKKLCWT
jgi:hypothetical protein